MTIDHFNSISADGRFITNGQSSPPDSESVKAESAPPSRESSELLLKEKPRDKDAIASCGLMLAVVTAILGDDATARDLRWAECIVGDLTLFDAWIQFREKSKGRNYENDPAEFREALKREPCSTMIDAVIREGLVSAYNRKGLASACVCSRNKKAGEEIASLLLNPNILQVVHVEIFGQPELPPAWASALEQGCPPAPRRNVSRRPKTP